MLALSSPQDRVFLSTLSVRRATIDDANNIVNILISIHALREESDDLDYDCTEHCTISIHALREESD